MKQLIIFGIIGILLLPTASALQLEDNLFFTIPTANATPDIRCVNAVFPDDSGTYTDGLETYTLSTDTEWASLSYRIITTNVDNSVVIPICYTKREDSLCSDPYVISILTHTYNVSRDYLGGVCVSDIPDVDIVPDNVVNQVIDNTDVLGVLNNNMDLFDVAFETDTKYVNPGEVVAIPLFLESHALLNIDLNVIRSDFDVSPSSEFTTTSTVNSFREIEYTLTAPLSSGTYSFDVEAKARNCEENFCTKVATVEVIVTDSAPDQGFTTKLFPQNLNIRELRPVLYRLTIDNNGPSAPFDIAVSLSEGLTSTLSQQTVNMPSNGKETITFSVTPTNPFSQYQITVTTTSGENSIPATAYLSTNEMLTDTERFAQEAINNNPDAANEINNILDDYTNAYNDTEYGNNLEDYQDVRDEINQATGGGEPPVPRPQGFDMNIFIIIIVIVVAVIILVTVLFIKKKQTSYAPDNLTELE